MIFVALRTDNVPGDATCATWQHLLSHPPVLVVQSVRPPRACPVEIDLK